MIFNKVLKTIKKHKMINPGEHIIVAVSGGADSVALLTVLKNMMVKWQLTLSIAHLNHGLRGAESRREASFVKKLADMMGLFHISEERDVLGYKAIKGCSLQEAARDVRYQFFRDVCDRLQAHKIALGHQANDQVETMLMWFLRGTSLNGLSGIPPVREGLFIRPLIEVSRQEIESYLKTVKTPHIEDKSFLEPHYLRNRIRHQLIPLLQSEYNPQVTKMISRLAELLRDDSEIIEGLVKKIVDKSFHQGTIFSIKVLKDFPIALRSRILKSILTRLRGASKSISFTHIEALCRLVDGGGPSRTVQLPGGWSALREYSELIFTKENDGKLSYGYSFNNIPENISIHEIKRKIFFNVERLEKNTNQLFNGQHNVEFLDFSAIRFPLIIRNYLPGDRFYPLGLGGSKKLKDFFIDKKISPRYRYKIPILLFENQIAWVGGLSIDHRFRLKPKTKKVLRIQIT